MVTGGFLSPLAGALLRSPFKLALQWSRTHLMYKE